MPFAHLSGKEVVFFNLFKISQSVKSVVTLFSFRVSPL